MKKYILHIERGRIIDTTPEVVSCMWENWDIYDALLDNKFQIKNIKEGVWVGKKKGIKVRVELVSYERDLFTGEHKYFATGQWLWFEKSVVGSLKYSRTADGKTSVMGIGELEYGLITGMIAKLLEKRLNKLANSIIEGGDYTCTLVSKNLEKSKEKLSKQQIEILDKYLKKIPFEKKEHLENLKIEEGTLSVIPTNGESLIRLETSVPKHRKIQIKINSKRFYNKLKQIYDEKILDLSSNFFNLSRSCKIITETNELLTLGEEFYNKAEYLGQKLYSLYIPRDISAFITSMLDYSKEITFKIEAEGRDLVLPWEILHNGEDFLCLRTNFTRASVNVSQFTNRPCKFNGFLVIASNPKNDLDYVKDEARIIYKIIKDFDISDVKIIEGKDATKDNVISELETGKYQALHYSGHSFYDESNPKLSFLLFEKERKLLAYELARMSMQHNLSLVFFNSCFSGCSLKTGKEIMGLSDSVVKQGVPYVIGMLWRVSDLGAFTLAKEFYRNLIVSNNPIEALRKARLKSGQAFDWKDPIWAAPIIYTQ